MSVTFKNLTLLQSQKYKLNYLYVINSNNFFIVSHAVSSSVERADLFRNGAVGGVLGLLGLVGRLKRVRLEGCSLRWYVW